MKKMILFIAAMLLVGTAAQAADQKLSDQVDRVTKRYRYAQPIIFVEGGITFFVYPNGEIDFKTPRQRNYNNWDWNSRNYNSPGRTRGYRHNNRFTVRYDYYGRLKRVGLTTIGYNQFDQVRRIGSVLIRYNRRGKLAKVGGLRVFYGKRDRIRHIEGNIHYTGCGFCGVDGCNITHDPYYNFNRRSNHYKGDDSDDDDSRHYKNRKRKNHDDDDD
ncbi:hypothetical protein D1818_03890 [Aquimarina sp. BL5]|uniref:hypothetical protein n=1 Tax=Aquimarina sp. BL5 TaxID=1714860 RepID=UPI000E4EB6FE|nr:hypothetical protein [Aquimarina sp. BL5]AXT50010.1 hypothetical protein D1818_03890 [Aquimarina sp. BL5]RKM93779.1 hypothetical protein D7036_22170 [Aquimarina sp. BL5]